WRDFWETFKDQILPIMHKFENETADSRRRKQARVVRFRPGDLVMHRLMNRDGKRTARAVGSFRVLRQLDTGDYQLEAQDGEKFLAAASFLHRTQGKEAEQLALRQTDLTVEDIPYDQP